MSFTMSMVHNWMPWLIRYWALWYFQTFLKEPRFLGVFLYLFLNYWHPLVILFLYLNFIILDPLWDLLSLSYLRIPVYQHLLVWDNIMAFKPLIVLMLLSMVLTQSHLTVQALAGSSSKHQIRGHIIVGIHVFHQMLLVTFLAYITKHLRQVKLLRLHRLLFLPLMIWHLLHSH